MAKENKISFRLDDDIMAILAKCDGENNSQRFENLVRECYQRLPELRRKCAEKQKYLDDLQRKYQEALQQYTNISQLKMHQTHMYSAYKEFLDSMAKLRDASAKVAEKLDGQSSLDV